MLDQAARLAATADEPLDQNFVRRNALAATDAGLTAEEAATRVFSNAPGAYGANINFQIESGAWEDDQMLADTFLARKSFAYGLSGDGRPAAALLASALRSVDAAFQNIDSIETGMSDIDHYFEYLGGVSKAVETVDGRAPRRALCSTRRAWAGACAASRDGRRGEPHQAAQPARGPTACCASATRACVRSASESPTRFGWSATARRRAGLGL